MACSIHCRHKAAHANSEKLSLSPKSTGADVYIQQRWKALPVSSEARRRKKSEDLSCCFLFVF